MYWKKIFVVHWTDKELLKGFFPHKNIVEKWAKNMNKQFTEEKVQFVDKGMCCLTLLVEEWKSHYQGRTF